MSHDLVLFEHPEWQKPQIHTGSAAVLLRLQQGGPVVSPLREGCIYVIHAILRAAVEDDGSLASWRFGRIHLARRFKWRVASIATFFFWKVKQAQ
jgi:hypothetical protein